MPRTGLSVDNTERMKQDPDPLLTGFNKLMEREEERERERNMTNK